jgi:F-type H+-transporting ATPase subunit gamma
MPGGGRVEKQIDTIEGLRDIIHSMRSLAATYLNRAEERLDGVRAYADTVGRAIEDCLYGREIALPEEKEGGAAVLAFFSEQGLCGRFNEIMAEAAATHAAETGRPRFIVVGRRGPALLRAHGLDVLSELPSTTSPDAVDAVIHAITRTVLELHGRGAVAQLYLLYARYLSPGRIEPRFERVLPLDLSPWREAESRRAAPPRIALPRLELLNECVNEYAFISLYRAMTESLAGENGMRLQSMEAARTNIDETLAELQQQARIQRQNDITEELLDVVSGAEALAGEAGARDV